MVPSPMRWSWQIGKRSMVAFTCCLLVLLSSGCGGSAEQRPLHGVWVIESADSLARRIGSAGLAKGPSDSFRSAQSPQSGSGENPHNENVENGRANPESLAIDGENAAATQAPRMEIWFRPSGVLKTFTRMGRINPEPKTGRWKLISVREQPFQMVIECDLIGQVTEHEVDFIDADTIELIPPNMAGTTRKIRFQRQQ